MKITKFVSITLSASGSTGQGVGYATINVPFKVKTIHCKEASYQPDTGTQDYVALISDLTQNSPIAILYRDATYSAGTQQDVEYQFFNPQPINGQYTFRILKMSGTQAPTTDTTDPDYIGLILEFNTEDEIM